MLSRITTTLTNKKFYLSPEKFKNLKIILEKNTKIQDDLNFEIVFKGLRALITLNIDKSAV